MNRESHQYDSTAADFEKALDASDTLNENSSKTLLAYIEHLFTIEHFDTLLLLIDDLITLDPNQHRYHYIKGESLRLTERYNLGITSLHYAIGLAPAISVYYDSIARAYSALEKYEKACEYAEAGLKIAPLSADNWVHLGDSYRHRNMFKKALFCFEKGKTSQTYPLALALCLRDKKKHEDNTLENICMSV